ncbi:PepSY domain-containing protein [Gracilibacillus sp. HCP3S3_G5_1]|uniref:PepSY domain-containing protein n=1 Tax=unclassified Gracilibacillus TaxID=2625209 RepID=UPI003F88C35D
MKNKTFFMIVSGLIVIGVLLAAVQFSATPASAYLSKEEAEEKVTAKFPGEIVEFELDDNEKLYEVEIEKENREFELKVDAETGEIISLEEKERKTSKEPTTDREEANNKVTTVALSDNKGKNSNDHDNQSDNKHTSKSSESKLISAEEVQSIATKEYPGIVKELELDEDDGQYYYELEIRTEYGEVELEIDAYSGEIIYLSVDDDGDSAKQHHSSDNKNSLISTDQARSIALEKFNGKIKELELDEDDDRYIYEIEIRTGKGEVELEIDAINGAILKVNYDD